MVVVEAKEKYTTDPGWVGGYCFRWGDHAGDIWIKTSRT